MTRNYNCREIKIVKNSAVWIRSCTSNYPFYKPVFPVLFTPLSNNLRKYSSAIRTKYPSTTRHSPIFYGLTLAFALPFAFAFAARPTACTAMLTMFLRSSVSQNAWIPCTPFEK